MSYWLQAIKRTPMRDLEPQHHFVLEVHNFLTDIRREANEVRKRRALERDGAHLRYLVGRLHGVVFGFASMAIYGGWLWLYEEVGESAMNEADFLTGAYQWLDA